MSETAHNLIVAFTSLPIAERHAVLLELARISQSDAGDLTDIELTLAGEQVFAMYDAEETERGESNAR